jgi:Sulfatase
MMEKYKRLRWIVGLWMIAASAVAAEKKPNVIFVFSDDQRYDSLSMNGDPIVQTPHLDQLASEGVFFEQAFVTSPICGPNVRLASATCPIKV